MGTPGESFKGFECIEMDTVASRLIVHQLTYTEASNRTSATFCKVVDLLRAAKNLPSGVGEALEFLLMVLEYYISVAEDLKGEDLRRAVREVFPRKRGCNYEHIGGTMGQRRPSKRHTRGARTGHYERRTRSGGEPYIATVGTRAWEGWRCGTAAHPAFAGTQTARDARRPARLHHGNGFNFLARQTILSDFGRAINGRRHKE